MRQRKLVACTTAVLMLVSLISGCGNASGETNSVVPADSPVRIAIIDTGISTAAINPSSLLSGKNYILEGESTEDLLGHGTAIASIIVGSESAGVEGLCPDALLIPLVIYSEDADGEEVKGDVDMAAQMIRDAIDIYHCDIINISFGDRVSTDALQAAVEYAEEKDVLIVSSVGNNGSIARLYPASYESVLCVGALNAELDGAAKFSNRNENLDVMAPGIDLPVALIDGAASTNSGSSFSAAYMSGLAAKLMMINSQLTAQQICQIFCSSATDISVSGFDKGTGWGAVNVEEAMRYASEGQQFRDVKVSDWFYAGAKFLSGCSLMKGTDAVHFTPQQITSRAMLWVMLHRMDGEAVSANASTWYSDAQNWVMSFDISDGEDPNGIIPREEITLTLWRYARYKGMDVDSVSYDLTTFPDASSVGKDALAAMEWACGTGLINGMDGMLAPAGNTTRAQIATILTRFMALL